MEDYRIRATLGVKPEYYQPERPEMLYLTRGATNSISYSLDDYGLSNLDNITFVFKQGKALVRYDWNVLEDAKHFEINEETELLTFWLMPEDTLQFKPSKSGNLVKAELVLTYGEDVIIEPLLPLIVVDSLISQIPKEEETATEEGTTEADGE